MHDQAPAASVSKPPLILSSSRNSNPARLRRNPPLWRTSVTVSADGLSRLWPAAEFQALNSSHNTLGIRLRTSNRSLRRSHHLSSSSLLSKASPSSSNHNNNNSNLLFSHRCRAPQTPADVVSDRAVLHVVVILSSSSTSQRTQQEHVQDTKHKTILYHCYRSGEIRATVQVCCRKCTSSVWRESARPTPPVEAPR